MSESNLSKVDESTTSLTQGLHALTHTFNANAVLFYNFVMNSNVYDMFNELNALKIEEKYLIGLVLGLITVILWCLVKRKKRLAKQYIFNKLQHEQGQMENYEAAAGGNKAKSLQSNKQRFSSNSNTNNR